MAYLALPTLIVSIWRREFSRVLDDALRGARYIVDPSKGSLSCMLGMQSTMANWNTVAMCVLGGILGAIPMAIPDRSLGGTPYDLSQEWKFAVNVAFGVWAAVVIFLTSTTDLTFAWKPFFGAMLTVGVAVMFTSHAILEGRIAVPWIESFRSLYRNESYRDIPYEPSYGPFLELFDSAHSVNVVNTLVLAHLSRLAYRSQHDLEAQAAAWPGQVRFLQERNQAGLVVSIPSAVIVAFRGTDDVRDWLTNAAIWQRSPWGSSWGTAHAGFISAVDALWPQLTNALRDFEVGSRRVWFTGHSLGGAMAVIAAVKLLNEHDHPKIGGICTFGQPMVGNGRFAKTLETQLPGQFVRFVTSRDDIPNQPPAGVHCGRLVYLDRNGRLHENPSFLFMLWDGLRRDALGAAGDHPMREYLRIIDLLFVQALEAHSVPEATV